MSEGVWRVQRFAEVASTNDEARQRALAGDPGRVWFVAERQSSGRGRHGRFWVSPAGNLYASALLIDPCAPEHAAELGFVAGLALVDALDALAARMGSAVKFELKWPNDVLFAGAKLAGVLVEGLTMGEGRLAAIVGIGVNCASAPEGLAYPAISLSAALGAPAPPDLLFSHLQRCFDANLARWARGAGFAAIRETWLACAAGIGAPIVVNRGGVRYQGRFSGLDATGRLRLERADGAVQFIEAGDVAPFSPQGGP